MCLQGNAPAEFDAPAVAQELSRLFDVEAVGELGRHAPLRVAARPNTSFAQMMGPVLALAGASQVEALMKEEVRRCCQQAVAAWLAFAPISSQVRAQAGARWVQCKSAQRRASGQLLLVCAGKDVVYSTLKGPGPFWQGLWDST